MISFLSNHGRTVTKKMLPAALCTFGGICWASLGTMLDSFPVIGTAAVGAPTQKLANQARPKATKSAQAIAGKAILWQEPSDLASRDLFYGIGGRAGAPNPGGKFTFLEEEGSPNDSNPKINVKDAQGRIWTVKFGPEVKAETTASRLVWAVGYHVDQNYFVKQATIAGFTRLSTENMRFEREDDGTEKVGRWEWDENPFVGTRELDGLKTLMALLRNVDLTKENNRIVRLKPNGKQLIYYVNDLGASLGSTGHWITSLPLLDKLATERKGDPEEYVKKGFIAGIENGEVDFRITRRQAEQALKGVKVAHARWMGDLLGRLSEKQLTDAFRAGGFTAAEVALYVSEMRKRITQLQQLEESLAFPGSATVRRWH